MKSPTLTMFTLLLLITFLCEFCLVEGRFRCPNHCSGHGYCSDYDNVCYCETGYQGIDCSQRKCPLSKAWADKAWASDKAHRTVECSNAGHCNTRTGVCECGKGFAGEACEKTTCGTNKCSGHGECNTIGEVYRAVSTSRAVNLTAEYVEGSDPPWEADHTTMCTCEDGYAGPACEYRLCPKGDDPMTPFNGYRTIVISITSNRDLASSHVSGEFVFGFNGESFRFKPGRRMFNNTDCKAGFQSLRNVEQVNCSVGSDSNMDVTYTVQLQKFPQLPLHENSLYQNDGNPPLDAFSCSTEEIGLPFPTDSITCQISDTLTNLTYPEYAFCSNRGICDFDNGICLCFQQFTNPNCDAYKLAVAPPSTRPVSSSVFSLEARSATFSATVLVLGTFDEATKAFDYVKIEDSDSEIFRLDGEGNVVMHYGSLVVGAGNNTQSNGMTIATSGLKVTGGITASTDQLQITGWVDVVAGGITVQNSGVTVTPHTTINGDIYVTDGLSISDKLNVSSGVGVAAGGGTVNTGGLHVVGGVTVNSGGTRLYKRGVTIYSDGLAVTGGISLNRAYSSLLGNAGMEVQSGGLGVSGVTVHNVGMDMGEGLTIAREGLLVDTGVTINSGGVLITDGVTIVASGIKITGGMTIQAGGLDLPAGIEATGGATVHNNGLYVTNGMTVDAAGLGVTGGFTVTSGSVTMVLDNAATITGAGVDMTGGLSISSAGLRVTAGLTVPTVGLVVSTGGMSVLAGGVNIYEGLSVLDSGLKLTGGLSIQNTGLYSPDAIDVTAGGVLVITGGVSVYNSALKITGGMTVFNSGILVTNGLSVLTEGLTTENILEINLAGLKVTKGLTVQNNALQVTGGMTVFTGGAAVSEGLSVLSAGLKVTAGMTVNDAGLMLTGGATVSSSGLYCSGGLSSLDAGLFVTNGFSVNSGSLRITGGFTNKDAGLQIKNTLTVYGNSVFPDGWTVDTGGLTVCNGITIEGNGLRITDGLTVALDGVYSKVGTEVKNGGLVTSDGMTVFNAGARIVTSGMTVYSGGVEVTGGATVSTVGAKITGGLSVANTGLVLPTGLTVKTDGVVVTAGVTVKGNGLTVASPLTVASGGVVMDSQLKLGANGLFITTSGLTIGDGGLVITTSGLTVATDGLKVTTNGLTVQNTGLMIFTDSVTVGSGGMHTKGSVHVQSLTFSSSTNTFANAFEAGGVAVHSLEPLLVMSDGVVVADDLTVNGYTNLETAYTTSDVRLKTNISVLQNALEMVRAVRGVTFRWADDAWATAGPASASSVAAATTKKPILTLRGSVDSSSTSSTASSYSSPDPAAAAAAVSEEEGGGAGGGGGGGERLHPTESRSRSRNDAHARSVGFLAQEVQRVLPEAVKHTPIGRSPQQQQHTDASASTSIATTTTTSKPRSQDASSGDVVGEKYGGGSGGGGGDGDNQEYLGVRYEDMIAVLIEAVKELDIRTKHSSSKSPSEPQSSSPTALKNTAKSMGHSDMHHTPVDLYFPEYFTYRSEDSTAMGGMPQQQLPYREILEVNIYNGTCPCGNQVLVEMKQLLDQVHSLEIQEKFLMQQLQNANLKAKLVS
mmetsp:Transcript_1447/g.2361  ORF Transcript_1447/g.2361 Transcript_1447/m.2361 type:complete len:1569 (-) Transcript_1447:152-4858(-)